MTSPFVQSWHVSTHSVWSKGAVPGVLPSRPSDARTQFHLLRHDPKIWPAQSHWKGRCEGENGFACMNPKSRLRPHTNPIQIPHFKRRDDLGVNLMEFMGRKRSQVPKCQDAPAKSCWISLYIHWHENTNRFSAGLAMILTTRAQLR